MKLIKTGSLEKVDQHSGFTSHAAWIDLQIDPALHSAVIAANINMLRRNAPYVYLFSNGYTAESWLAEDIGDEGYRSTLDVKSLKTGVWLASPSFSVPVQTVATAILTGDILPFVHLLDDEEYAFLCLPAPLSLNKIDELVARAGPGAQAAFALLASGGFIVSVIDLVRLKLLSRDEWWDRQEAVRGERQNAS